MKPGDLYWADIPLANGHEQSGRRPVLVLQDEKVGGQLPTVLIVPMTTARATRRFRGTMGIKATSENGLRQDSIALLFQIRAIDRKRFEGRIGAVSAEVLQAAFTMLDELMGR